MIQNIRLLKAVVIVLGLVIVIGMGALLLAFAQTGKPGNGENNRDPGNGEALTPNDFTSAAALERIQLPAGARILEMDLDGGRIALRLALPDGTEELAVYDLATGERLGALAIAP